MGARSIARFHSGQNMRHKWFQGFAGKGSSGFAAMPGGEKWSTEVQSRVSEQKRHAIRRLICIACFVLALGSGASFLHAQQQTAEITGTITDKTSAVIPGAAVTIRNSAHGVSVTVTSDASGRYAAPLLLPAEGYSITVTKPGFDKVTRSNITLAISQIAEVDIALPVGSLAQIVTVTGAPPLLDTQTSSVGQLIAARTIRNLPLNGRSTFRLIQLTPGVIFNQAANGIFGDVPTNTTFDGDFSVNGGRAQSNEILIDGVPSTVGFFNQITTIPSVDDTQEFNVQSDNLPAIYGRFGGGVINVTTKSGTNSLHGTVFEFLRNSALDANDYFSKQKGLSVPPFKMNQFGFAVGGPVLIPKIYNGHDKTYFFVDYQGTRRIQGTTFITTVPTDAQRKGDFSATYNAAGKLVTIYNPFSTRSDPANPGKYIRDAFPGNKIPSGMLDPVAQKLISYYPEPNTQGAPNTNANNYISDAPLSVNQNSGSVRIDQKVNSVYRLFGRFAWMLTTQTQPNTYNDVASPGAGAVGTTELNNWSFSQNNTFALSPSLLLTANYGYARWFQSRQTLSYGFDAASLGFPSSFTNSIQIPMFPTINMVSYGNMSGQSYLSNGNDSHSLLTSLTWIHGRQTLIFGTDFRLHLINLFFAPQTSGTFAFTRAQTQGPNPTTASNVAGDAMASLLLGTGSSGSIPISAGNSLKDWYYAGYVQDDIHVTKRLTANLGFRYETESPYTDRHNRLNYFDPSVPSPAANSQFPNLTGGLVFAGVNGGSSSVYQWNRKQFDPRVGIAYSLNDATVFRGGFGVVYAPLEISTSAVGFAPNAGFSSSTSWQTSTNGGLNPANLLSDPYPQGLVEPAGSSEGAATQLGQSISVWDRNAHTPESYQWNVGIQRQLPSSILLDLTYIGTRGIHLTAPFELNQLNPKYLSLGTGLNTLVPNPFQPYVSIGALSQPKVAREQLLLPYPQFTDVTEVNSTWGGSNYQAAQVKLNKRITHGVSFLVAYTFSKWLSNVENAEAEIGPSNKSNVQNYYDLAAEKSLSESDIPQSLIANAVVKLPIGQGQWLFSDTHGVVNRLISGWTGTAILTEQSGVPLVFTAPVAGIGSRPNYVPGVSPRLSGSRPTADKVSEWFNTAAFSIPPAYTLGDVSRTDGAVRGPSLRNLDASLVKTTQLFERLNMEFHAQVFNLTNTPHFSLPNTAVNSATFGQITSTVLSPPAREYQFAVKFLF